VQLCRAGRVASEYHTDSATASNASHVATRDMIRVKITCGQEHLYGSLKVQIPLLARFSYNPPGIHGHMGGGDLDGLW